MRFAEKRKWIDDNPATELKAPKVPNKPTMPFTREEMIRIFAALEPYGKSAEFVTHNGYALSFCCCDIRD